MFKLRRNVLLTSISFIIIFIIAALYAKPLVWPNRLVNLTSAPVSEQNNADVAISEVVPGEIYSVWSEFAPPGFGTSLIGFGQSPDGGLTWTSAIMAAPPPYTGEWNPAIGALPIGVGPNGGFMMINTSYGAGPPWMVPNAIQMDFSPGGGAGFTGRVPIVANTPGTNWYDYPNLDVDDYATNPPPAYGTGHMAWVEYIDGTGGDSDGNGNPFDDPGDSYTIWYAYSHFIPGAPPVYPAFSAPLGIFGGPVSVNQLAAHRPDLSVMAAGNPVIPPGGVYIAWTDGTTLFVDASTGPGAGFGFLGGAPVPFPIAAVPPVINPAINAAPTATIAVDNSPGPCAGNVYVAYADMSSGDLDIFFMSSPTGIPGSWTAPVRVNQDPIGNMLDQWAPELFVDPGTGDISITYYSRRNDTASPNVNIETFVAISTNCGLTWTEGLISDAGPTPPVSTFPMPPAAAYFGDYLGADMNLLNGPGFIWNDGRNGVDQDIFFENTFYLDTDGDGVPDAFDNCPAVPNPMQLDYDADGIGDACDPDIDGDGLSNVNEATLGTNPYDDDTDDDGLLDGSEDANDNGIIDPGETNPNNPDSDGDGLQDGTELGLTAPQGNDTAPGAFIADMNPGTTTNPLDDDTDDDGLTDGAEDANFNGAVDPAETDPNMLDSDSDGLQDGTEIGLTAPMGTGTNMGVFIADSDPGTTTNPLDDDTDDDGLTDGAEDANFNGAVDSAETDPNLVDTDNDGLQDGTEIGLTAPMGTGTNMGVFIPDTNPGTTTNPLDDDTDDDGLTDGAEDANFNGAVDPAETDPNMLDSDSDGLQDGTEIGLTAPMGTGTNMGVFIADSDPGSTTNPLDDDTDDDGLTDGSEDANFNGAVDSAETDPNMLDSDSDGLQDGTEIGLTAPMGTGTNMGVFIADSDPGSTTNPLDDDTDDDGLKDGIEDANANGHYEITETDPNNNDTDGDLLLDGVEDVNANGIVDANETDPRKNDTDADGLDDGDEVLMLGTNPLLTDSEADNVDDYTEVYVYGGSVSSPTNTDGDALINALDPDDDGDGILTINEDPNGNGDPTDDDSDGDGIPDYLDPAGPTYICGDANSDLAVNVSDAVWIINYVFVGGPPPSPLASGDANCDSAVNVSDAVWIINYVFVGGNAPCDTDGDTIPDC